MGSSHSRAPYPRRCPLRRPEVSIAWQRLVDDRGAALHRGDLCVFRRGLHGRLSQNDFFLGRRLVLNGLSRTEFFADRGLVLDGLSWNDFVADGRLALDG